MGKGSYLGGSTIIGPGSAWFSRGRKRKSKGKAGGADVSSSPPSPLEIAVAARLKAQRKLALSQPVAGSPPTQQVEKNSQESAKHPPTQAKRESARKARLRRKKAVQKAKNTLSRETLEERTARLAARLRAPETRKSVIIARRDGAHEVIVRVGLDESIPGERAQPGGEDEGTS